MVYDVMNPASLLSESVGVSMTPSVTDTELPLTLMVSVPWTRSCTAATTSPLTSLSVDNV